MIISDHGSWIMIGPQVVEEGKDCDTLSSFAWKRVWISLRLKKQKAVEAETDQLLDFGLAITKVSHVRVEPSSEALREGWWV